MVTLRAPTGLRRLLFLFVLLCLSIYYLPRAANTYSLNRTRGYGGRRDPPVLECPANTTLSSERWMTTGAKREKAAILLLARDDDLEQLLPTLANFEETFNARFRYPYVFLNEVGLGEKFKQGVKNALPVGAVVEYGEIPKAHWSMPEWVDKEKAMMAFRRMKDEGIQYGDREGYHHMCRYYSGLFALHPLMLKYDYYWRLEPGVRFFCELQYDPFLYMSTHRKVYGWVITIVETPNTIPGLFESILDWRTQVTRNNSASNRFGDKLQLADWSKPNELWDFYIRDTERTRSGQYRKQEEYNLCHMWTNFEIGDLRFFRSKEYQSLFNHLDRTGGFYYERWGDAPIRSLALGLLAGFDKVHYFEDIVYKHDWFMHVPQDPKIGCNCKPPPFEEWTRDIDNDGWYSCLPRWRALDTAR